MSYKNTVKDYSQMIGWLTRDKTTDVPGSMAHGLRTGLYDGGRAGFDNGQLVQPSADGSRPGYSGSDRVVYKEINKLTDANRANFKYPPDHKYKVQIPTREDIGRGSLRTFSAKTKKELKKLVDESPITQMDYSKGLVKKSKLKLPEGAINFDESRYKIPTGEYVGKGRNRSQIFSLHSKFNPDAAVRYFTSPGRRLFNSIEETKAGKAKISKDMSKPVKTKTERAAKNIVKNTYEIPATGETYVKYKPFIGEEKITIEGAGADTLEEAQKFVDDYISKNPDFGKTGQTLKLEDDLRTLFNDPKIKPLLETGTPDKKYIKIAQNAIKGLTESQAEDKLKQLAEAVKPDGVYNIEGIDKINQNKANDIYKFFKSKDISRKIEDKAIGQSVGEGSIAKPRSDIQGELPFEGGTKTYSVDEAKAIKGSYRLGSKPYSIFGQVIDGRINQGAKMGMDAKLSQFEEGVQKAIRGEGDLTVKQAIDKYNAAATQAEKEMNAYKSRGFRKITIPRIAKAPPSQTIANKKAYKKYKKFFDKNFKELGYSFRIPKDMLPVPEIAAGMKDKKSPLYKRYFNDIKKAAGQFIDNVDQYNEKELFQKLQKSPMFEKFKKILPRLVSNDDFSEKRYASANNIMSDATYVDDMEEENFIKRNPGTTALGTTALGTAAAATTPKGRNVLKKIGKGIFDKGIRPLGTNLAVVPLNAYTIYDNLKKGENIADAVIDPYVGAEFMLPGLFKENVNKITKNKAIQNLLTFGKYGRMMTPVGAGITAGGLGIDAYKYGKKRIAELQAMSPEERAELAQKRDDFSFGEYSGAAEGGIASLNVNKK